MFQAKWFRAVLVMAVLASLLVAPLVASAQGAATTSGITAPADGATVSGTVKVVGEAVGDLSKWEVLLFANGDIQDGNKAWLAGGNAAGPVSYDLDTTKYPDGKHALVLRVVQPNSNYTDYVTMVTFANATAPVATAPVAAAPTATVAAPTAALSDIVDTAVAAGSFKTLVAAVQAAGLVDTLKGTGPYTVFAPTDEAFAKLPAGTVEGLLKDPKALSNILLYHVLPGKVMGAQVTDGLTAKTVQGSTVTFAVADGKAKINDANIVKTDIETSNGVIHVIDTVLLPPAAPAADAKPAVTPTNGITSPKAAAKISGAATVTGYANDPNFKKWQLDVLPGGNADAAIFVALGENAGEFSQALDTTKFPDGDHALRLRVVKSDSNYDEYVTPFTLANAAAPAAETKPAATAAVTPTTTTVAPVETAPAAAPAAESGITAPKADASVSGTVTVTGNVAGAFSRWELLLFPNGDISGGNKVWLAGGDKEGAFSYDLDTTKYPDGKHALVLRVVNANSNYTDYPVMVTFANAPAAPAQ